MKQFTAYKIIRVDGQYDPEITNEKDAVNLALEQVIAEAKSNAQFNGKQDGVQVDDVGMLMDPDRAVTERHMFYGEDAVIAMRKGADAAMKAVMEGNGTYKDVCFDTPQEMAAYMQGLDDGNSWGSYFAIEDYYPHKDIPEEIQKAEKRLS